MLLTSFESVEGLICEVLKEGPIRTIPLIEKLKGIRPGLTKQSVYLALRNLKKDGDDSNEILKKVDDLKEAMFINEIGPHLSVILGMLKDSFRAKCCPIKAMKLVIGIKYMPDPRSTAAHPLPYRPRVTEAGLLGCPPKGSPDYEVKSIRSSIIQACALSEGEAGEEFNSDQLMNHLVLCSHRIDSTAPVQTEQSLKNVNYH